MSSEKASNSPGLLDHREICCEDGRRLELAQDHV